MCTFSVGTTPSERRCVYDSRFVLIAGTTPYSFIKAVYDTRCVLVPAAGEVLLDQEGVRHQKCTVHVMHWYVVSSSLKTIGIARVCFLLKNGIIASSSKQQRRCPLLAQLLIEIVRGALIRTTGCYSVSTEVAQWVSTVRCLSWYEVRQLSQVGLGLHFPYRFSSKRTITKDFRTQPFSPSKIFLNMSSNLLRFYVKDSTPHCMRHARVQFSSGR
jgi:hypothetical protein